MKAKAGRCGVPATAGGGATFGLPVVPEIASGKRAGSGASPDSVPVSAQPASNPAINAPARILSTRRSPRCLPRLHQLRFDGADLPIQPATRFDLDLGIGYLAADTPSGTDVQPSAHCKRAFETPADLG